MTGGRVPVRETDSWLVGHGPGVGPFRRSTRRRPDPEVHRLLRGMHAWHRARLLVEIDFVGVVTESIRIS
jgi:hypothetical protein